jgi:glycosyltransferase involved in cell wall biosynthesis
MKIRLLYALEAAEGGALKHLMYLVTHLDQQCFDLTVVVSTRRFAGVQEDIKQIRALGIPVIEMPMTRPVHFFKDIFFLYKAWRLLRRCRFDVVHAHSSKAGALFRIAAWLTGVQAIVYTPHCFYFQGQQGWRRQLFFYIEKMLAGITDAIIVSENEKKEALAGGLCAAHKLYNINNAVPFRDQEVVLSAVSARRKYGIAPHLLVLGTVCRMEKQKNLPLFLQVAQAIVRRHDHSFFVIAGIGSEQSRIAQLVSDMGLGGQVLLTGYTRQVQEIYALIDIFISTSLWEGLPYSVLEAAYFKKPIVTTFASDFEFEPEETPPIDALAALTARIEKLLAQKERLQEIGMANRQRMLPKYAFEVFITRHEQLYNDLVKPSAHENTIA